MSFYYLGPNRRQFMRRSLAGGAAAVGLSQLPHVAAGEEPKGPKIEVYTGKMSCAAGETMPLHVSTTLPAYRIRISRVGAKPQLVWEKAGQPGKAFPVPADAALRGCGWPVALEVPVGPDWRSGIYRLQLEGEGARTESFFIVRPAEFVQHARILLQLSTNTYQAYNAWGGSSLYSGPSFPRVSFDRPFLMAPPVTTPVTGFYNPNDARYQTWDEPFLVWAEECGYELDYCANLDLEFHPELLEHYRLVLSIGHDEYWSAGMRNNLEAFIARGGNAAFLSGNSVCWQVRVEDEGRALVCYKRAHEKDPAFAGEDKTSLTSLWSEPLLGRPENLLTGVGFAYGGYNAFFDEFVQGPGAGEYTVHQPDHWLFGGTGLKQGETFGKLAPHGPQPGIAGYECDGCEFVWQDGKPVPTGRDGTPESMQILATAPSIWSKADGSLGWAQALRKGLPARDDIALPEDYINRPGAAVFGIYERGGTVVTTGSCGWSYGLQARHHVVDRIVRNLLDRLSV